MRSTCAFTGSAHSGSPEPPAGKPWSLPGPQSSLLGGQRGQSHYGWGQDSEATHRTYSSCVALAPNKRVFLAQFLLWERKKGKEEEIWNNRKDGSETRACLNAKTPRQFSFPLIHGSSSCQGTSTRCRAPNSLAETCLKWSIIYCAHTQ